MINRSKQKVVSRLNILTPVVRAYLLGNHPHIPTEIWELVFQLEELVRRGLGTGADPGYTGSAHKLIEDILKRRTSYNPARAGFGVYAHVYLRCDQIDANKKYINRARVLGELAKHFPRSIPEKSHEERLYALLVRIIEELLVDRPRKVAALFFLEQSDASKFLSQAELKRLGECLEDGPLSQTTVARILDVGNSTVSRDKDTVLKVLEETYLFDLAA